MEIKTEELFGIQDVKLYKDHPQTIVEVFQNTISKYPSKNALFLGQKRITYEEWNVQAEEVAAGFISKYGIKKGDRVAVILGNGLEFPIIFLACMKVGAIMVPINIKLSESEVQFIINDSDPSLIICDKAFESKINKDDTRFVELLDTEKFSNSLTDIQVSNDNVKPVDLVKEDSVLIMYTSGTTGKPKGAVISHINLVHTVMSYKNRLKLDDSFRTIIAVPLFHITGLAAQLLELVYLGGSSVILKKYNNDKYIQEIIEKDVNFLFNVPSIFMMMRTSDLFYKHSFESIKCVAYGGSPIYQETLELLEDSFPNATLHNAYGSTETTSPVTIMPQQYPIEKATSAGPALEVAEVVIINDEGEECPPGAPGELTVKGPMVIKEYWRNEAANMKSLIKGFWQSGDIATKDEEGFIYILDRKKDMVNRSGEKVFSIEVEDVLKKHPDIEDAAVTGIPHPIFIEQVSAYIVSDKLNNEDIASIQEYCKEYLADFKIPEVINFIDELPRNAAGKVLKHHLNNITNSQ